MAGGDSRECGVDDGGDGLVRPRGVAGGLGCVSAGPAIPAVSALAPEFDAAGASEALALDGFHVFPAFLAPPQLEALRAAFDARLDPGAGGELDLGCRWSDETAWPFLQVLLDERLLDFLAATCGLPLVALRLELFGKAPGSASAIPWHQDTYTTHTGFAWTPDAAAEGRRPHPVTLWVALDDVSRENGGMEMVRGRHRELLNHLHPSRAAVPEDALSHDEVVEYGMVAGQAGVHHPLAPHRSLPNAAARPRRAFLVRLSPWTARSEELCGVSAEGLLRRASESGWTQWRSEPAGRYAWIPGNAACLGKERALNRLLICCRQPAGPRA